MDRDALWGMMLFVETVERGSLAAAARVLRITPSAVSKQISKLEARLGVRLVQRTTRSLRLTAAGTRYRDHAVRVVAALGDAEADVQREGGSLRGRVRLSTPAGIGQRLVAPVVARFIAEHPDVEIELDVSERFVDLVSDGIDIAVRVAPRLPSSGLAARKLGVTEWVLVASPSYLARRGAPKTPPDLAKHTCLDLMNATDRGLWRLTTKGRTETIPVHASFVSSNQIAVTSAALEGVGIARLPLFMVRDELDRGELVRVLPGAIASRRFVFVLLPSRAYVARRVRAFADALVLGLGPVLDRASPSKSANAKRS